MRHNGLSIGLKATLAIFTLALFVTNTWAATHQILHSFNPNGVDAAYPQDGLIADTAGNRYGTTFSGGSHNVGAVFEISPRQGGGWTEKVLYSFDNNGRDGQDPEGVLILDAAGNLYGTTNTGGIHGLGAVFELTPNGSGGWTETILHSFGNGTDGASPYGGMIFDSAGSLYTTTQTGGVYDAGTVVKLSPRQGGGWTETVLHNFNPNTTDGINPEAGLVRDSAGNMYGATYYGGIHGFGTVFKLAPNGSGGWTETVLHSLGNGTDGQYPYASLIVDSGGNLYGTTVRGGIHSLGTVFELKSNGSGGWTETVLHSFGNGTDGTDPYGGLIFDGAGNLYGTTISGGIHGFGTVFEMKPNGSGGWTETVLRSFAGSFHETEGANPYGGLILDSAGNLYGTTLNGGISEGAVFELSPDGSGGWTEKVVHSFGNGTDGIYPFDSLVIDGFGNLYGTTYRGGIHNYGTVFELSPNGSGGWTERVLHSFNFNGADGAVPYAGLVIDSAGNLYGTTAYGGINYYGGTVFELSPNGSGGWTEKVLHSFNYNGTDGAFPTAGLIFDSAGNLYGTTENGGIHFQGAVFQLTPQMGGSWTERVLLSFNGSDGAYPEGSLVRFGSSADLYGTTSNGGVNGAGTVFKMTPTQGGNWVETVLHNFSPGDSDGNFPQGNLMFDSSGNLYGATPLGGTFNSGTVFEITP